MALPLKTSKKQPIKKKLGDKKKNASQPGAYRSKKRGAGNVQKQAPRIKCMKHYDIKKHLFVFLFLLIGTFTVASGQVKSSVSEDTNNSAVTEENLYNALVKKLDAAKVPYNKTALRQTIRQRLASKEIPSPFF